MSLNAPMKASKIKELYESNADTNEFDDSEQVSVSLLGYLLADDEMFQNDTEKTYTLTLGNTWYTCKKIEITTLPLNASSSIRIEYKYRATISATNALYVELRKNGSTWGTQQSISSDTTWYTFKEDLAGLANGDVIQIYAKRATGGAGAPSANLKEMRILGRFEQIDATSNDA